MSAIVDPYALAQRAATVSGEPAVAEFERLLASLAQSASTVHWQAAFSQHGVAGEMLTRLALTVQAELALPCVRCLEAVSLPLQLHHSYRLVGDEGTAATLDDSADSEDVLSADRRFDLHALIEDELIMALPLMPRHGQCAAALVAPDSGDAGASPDGPDDDRQFPFADLAARLAGTAQQPVEQSDRADAADPTDPSDPDPPEWPEPAEPAEPGRRKIGNGTEPDAT